MPLRVDGPDIVTKADKRAVAREHAKARARRKSKDDPVFGFVKRAASTIGDLPEALSSEVKETYKGVKSTFKIGSGRQPRAAAIGPGRQVNTRNVRAATAMAAEMTNIPAMQRIAEGRATKSDLAILALAAAPGLNAVARAPTMKAFGITPTHANRIIKEGEAVVYGRTGQKRGLEEIEDMIEGVPPTIARRHPGRNLLYTQDIGYPWRIPFLTQKQRGHINLGDFGESHGGLLRTIFKEGITPEIAGRYRQGMISRPDSSAANQISTGVGRADVDDIRIDLGYGRVWGTPEPANTAPTHKFLMHLLRNYPDEAVQIGWGKFRNPKSPDRDEIFEQWVEDLEKSYKPHTYWRHQDPWLPPTPKGGRADFEETIDVWNRKQEALRKKWAAEDKKRRRKR